MQKSFLVSVLSCWLALCAPASELIDLTLQFTIPERNPLGQRLTYSLIVSNAGPGAATQVWLTNQVPSQLANSIITVSQGSCTITNRLLRCELGTLAAGNTAAISIAAVPTAVGGSEMSARAMAREFDTNWVNNTGIAFIRFGVADLAVMVQPQTNQITAGVPFKVDATVTNLGPDIADGVLMFSAGNSDYVPTSYTLSQGQVIEVREGGIPWMINFGSVSANSSARLTVTLIPKRAGNL